MKPKTLILLVVAVSCGLVASYMTSRVIADRGAPQEEAKVPVVYATKNVQQGYLVKNPDECFAVRMMPDSVAPRGRVIRDLNELRDKRLVNPVGADKHISLDDLLDPKDSGLTYRIPPGMRAVAVKVSTDSSVAGFVQPGMFVDIMCVPNGRNECKTIMQKVQILAVNMLDHRDPERRAMETYFMTFAVSPDDSEKLSLASHSGQLRLSLRHVDDEKVVDTRGAKAEDLARLSRDQHEATQPTEPTTSTTQPTTTPILPLPPAEQTPTVAVAPLKQPEPPAQPKVTWTLVIREGNKTSQHKFYDEPPITVEKSDPEGEPDSPATPPKKDQKPSEKTTETPDPENSVPGKNPAGN